jgi:hypothetical protein
MNAGAGEAASNIGSSLHGVPPLTFSIQMGALASVTKAAVTMFRGIILMADVNMALVAQHNAKTCHIIVVLLLSMHLFRAS